MRRYASALALGLVAVSGCGGSSAHHTTTAALTSAIPAAPVGASHQPVRRESRRKRHPHATPHRRRAIPAPAPASSPQPPQLNPSMAAAVTHVRRGQAALAVEHYSYGFGNRLTVTVNPAKFLCALSAGERLRAVESFYRSASSHYAAQNAGGLSVLVLPAGAGSAPKPLAIANEGGAMLTPAGRTPTRC